MRPGSKLSHGTEVFFLLWGEPVESNPEEAFIESGNRRDRCLPYYSALFLSAPMIEYVKITGNRRP